jgi:hypothetical protein
MSTEPSLAKTVFWIVDNGSSHAGQRSIARLEDPYQNARLIHLPIHASWSADPRLVAEPDRDLLLDPAAQGADPERLHRSSRARRSDRGVRGPLPPDRQAVRVDLHPGRPRRPARQAGQPRATAAHRRLTADSTPAGVRVTRARTATDWITLAHNSCRDPLARSISATAANSRPHLTATRIAITARASRARSNGVPSSSSTSSPTSSSSSAIASHNYPNAGESNFGSSTCNDRSRHGSQRP